MFDAAKLHTTFAGGCKPDGPVVPRRYTLTHSDRTGDLFLTIGCDYDREALSALQVRLERDEVLGEWILDSDGPRLELNMMAQGGLPILRHRRDAPRHLSPLPPNGAFGNAPRRS